MTDNIQDDELFPNSFQIDPEVVMKTCGSRLMVRLSRHETIAVKAMDDFKRDWAAIGGKPFYGCTGGDGHNLASLGLPESLPDRTYDFMRYTEYYFAIDDSLVELEPEEVQKINDAMMEILPGEYKSASNVTNWKSAERQMLAEISMSLVERDRKRAYAFLKATQRYHNFNNLRKDFSTYTWDQWCRRRWEDGDSYAFLASIPYFCGLDLTQKDFDETLMPIAWPGMMCTLLTNDLYSFDPEVHTEFLGDNFFNAVWYWMKALHITVTEAKAVLFDKIKGWETKFLDAKTEFLASHPDTPLDFRKYLAYVECMVAGNWFWHGTNPPRYVLWMNFAESGRRMVVLNNPANYDPDTAKCETFIEINPTKGDTTKAHGALFSNVKADDSPADDPTAYSATLGDGTAKGTAANATVNGPTTTGAAATPNGIVNGATSKGNTVKKPIHSAHSQEIVLAPIEYLRSMPSKGVRTVMINALDVWCSVRPSSLVRVENIISALHDASLMFDDIEDGSPMRRGLPSTHAAFGVSQTINSANFLYALALSQAIELPSPKSIHVFSEELQNMHIGQAADLKWTHSRHCPSVEDYKIMVQNKTGGLFRMLAGLLCSEGQAVLVSKQDLLGLMTMLGEYFQVRDDYINLCSSEYHSQKGFCEDLDEGKFSLPLIHLLSHTKRLHLLESLLCECAYHGNGMTLAMKQLVYREMENSGSLDFTRRHLVELESVILRQIAALEQQAGAKNYVLRLVFDKLRIE
ncbi:isoprenoid synthase domain-containing protein [Aspergillus insuetus]